MLYGRSWAVVSDVTPRATQGEAWNEGRKRANQQIKRLESSVGGTKQK